MQAAVCIWMQDFNSDWSKDTSLTDARDAPGGCPRPDTPITDSMHDLFLRRWVNLHFLKPHMCNNRPDRHRSISPAASNKNLGEEEKKKISMQHDNPSLFLRSKASP